MHGPAYACPYAQIIANVSIIEHKLNGTKKSPYQPERTIYMILKEYMKTESNNIPRL